MLWICLFSRGAPLLLLNSWQGGAVLASPIALTLLIFFLSVCESSVHLGGLGGAAGKTVFAQFPLLGLENELILTLPHPASAAVGAGDNADTPTTTHSTPSQQ